MDGSSSRAVTCVFLVDGVFDVPAAQSLATKLAEVDGEADLAIDLTHVREFHDFGVSLLALAVARSRSRVRIRGLRRHHEQLLHYLGMSAALGSKGAELC